jgi:hypothetical protein
MLDAASSDLVAAAGSSTSIPPSATDLAAVTIAAALSEANMQPPSSVGVNVTATAITMAAAVADDARYDPATNVDSGPSPAALGNNADEGGPGNTLVQVAVLSVISNATKSSLRAYFEGVNWPLNKALPKGAEFLNGPLGDIMRQFLLMKMQVAHQLLNYKKEKYLNTQVLIILNLSDLDERFCKGTAMSLAKFVSSSLMRICNPDTGCGSNFNNLCTMMSLLPLSMCTYVMLVANSPEDNWFSLLVGVVENWIHDMAERFPNTAAGIPNAQLEFERRKESNMRVFIHKFMKEYNSSSLS